MIRYRSTRATASGGETDLGFGEVLLAGLAPDGGLYCPVDIPALSDLAPVTAGTPYAEAATTIIAPYVAGTFDEAELGEMVTAAYAGFRDPDICPIHRLEPDQYLLDLTRGPTLAFKDMALQLVARMLDAELERRGEHVTVIGATSGDTGSAAIEALAGRANIRVVILHPLGRVSEVQRRQMTTVDAANISNLAVRGTFDDCQDLVKAAFADTVLRSELKLAAVNSINWARVVSQIPYYVVAARRVSPDGGPVSFAVPTGNFGNVLAGWYGKRMGLAVDRFVVASNRNDVLTRFFETGRLIIESVEPSLSPSMDIQVSSNFERLLWEAGGRVGEAITELITALRTSGRVEVPASWCQVIASDFDGLRLDDEGTLAVIADVLRTTERLVDPHTAVGIHAARKLGKHGVPMVTLATADPAKFPDAVESATGRRPELPPHLAELFDRTEHYDVIDNSSDSLAAALRGER
ncbi:MAG: threonine synthase [Acidimicrobiia bacterium]|nr:threonine synthase [Acidimicrobiia bacterium]